MQYQRALRWQHDLGGHVHVPYGIWVSPSCNKLFRGHSLSELRQGRYPLRYIKGENYGFLVVEEKLVILEVGGRR